MLLLLPYFIDSGFSDHMIQDIISSYMVLPNRITVPLIGEVKLEQLRFPMPKVNIYTVHIPVLTIGHQHILHMIIVLWNMSCRIEFTLSRQGVLRINFLEAQNLEAKDTYLGGLIRRKSDPYGRLLVCNQNFRSKTIKECLEPKWNEVYEVKT